MSGLIRLGPEEAGMVSLLSLLEAPEYFIQTKPTPICYATSSSTTGGNNSKYIPDPVLESIAPIPRLVEDLKEVIKPQLEAILVPANSQFVAIVHPISTALPFKRLHRLEKDNESQFEQENLAPVFKIMAYYIAYKRIQKENHGAEPGYTSVLKLWTSPQFQKSHFRFFASSTISTNHITDFAIHVCLPMTDGSGGLRSMVYEESFAVKAVIEVKTTTVLTDSVFEDITGWYNLDNGERQFVLGMAIQYVWQTEAPKYTRNDSDGGERKDRTRDKIFRQVWNQMIQEGVEYALLTTATSSYYLFRRRSAESGDLYISPPYNTADNVALYSWLAAAFEIHDVNSDTIITPDLNKEWWDQLPTFEATGIRPATLPMHQANFQDKQVGLGHGPVSRKRKRSPS